MRKTITITDPMKVKTGDKAYFKDCDFGFDVTEVDADDEYSPISVFNPLSGRTYWVDSSCFDHAERTVKESEWPDPNDLHLHVYIGADGMRYVYNPCIEPDPAPWIAEGYSDRHSRNAMETYCRDALPLTELRLVSAKDDDDE